MPDRAWANVQPLHSSMLDFLGYTCSYSQPTPYLSSVYKVTHGGMPSQTPLQEYQKKHDRLFEDKFWVTILASGLLFCVLL